MTDYISYEEALDTYFSLKKEYDNKYNKSKGKIINNSDLTKKEKRKQIQAIKMKCISCSRDVGTIFEDKDRILSAICGDKVSPCDFHIELRKSSNINILQQKQKILNDKDHDEEQIRNLKLMFLFGFISEDELTEIYPEIQDIYNTVLDDYDIITRFEKEHLQIDERKNQIRLLNIEKYNLINETRDLLKEYLATQNHTLIKDVVELNTQQMQEINEKLMNNKYHEVFLNMVNDDNEDDDGSNKKSKNSKIVQLIQNQNSMHDVELTLEDGEILNYTL